MQLPHGNAQEPGCCNAGRGKVHGCRGCRWEGIVLTLLTSCTSHFLSVPLAFFTWLEIFLFTFIFIFPFLSTMNFDILSAHVAEFMSKTHPEAGDDAAVSADPVAGAV